MVQAALCATALSLGGCATATSNASSGPAASGGATTTASGEQPSASAPATATTTAANGTAGTRLTISNGTSQVLMDGKTVDFGTEVHDLAWSPDGKLAAFIDGTGGLSVANPDGSNRVEVAKNPGGQTWSHPAWLVRAPGDTSGAPPRDELVFASGTGATATLQVVDATAHDGTPRTAELSYGAGYQTSPPQTGNDAPNGLSPVSAVVFENVHNGTGDVYMYDEYLRVTTAKQFADGRQPALHDVIGKTTDDRDIAFVRASKGHDHIFEATLKSGANGEPLWTFTDLTPSAMADLSDPAWSSDGKQVAFATPDQIDVVDVAHPGQVTVVSNATGVPAFRP